MLHYLQRRIQPAYSSDQRRQADSGGVRPRRHPHPAGVPGPGRVLPGSGGQEDRVLWWQGEPVKCQRFKTKKLHADQVLLPELRPR